MGACQFYVVGCCIPPSDLVTLTCVDKAWSECPRGAHPILVGDLNINLCSPCTECKETIVEQVEAMGLVDMSRHFCQRLGKRLRDYFLGRETDRRRFQGVSIRLPLYYSDHRALVAVIYAEGGGGVEAVPKADATIPPLPSPGPQGTARCRVRGAPARCSSSPPKGASCQQLDHRQNVEGRRLLRAAA